MATPLIPRRSNADNYRHYVSQKYLVEKHYSCFRCHLSKGTLTCVGTITPSEHCKSYRVEIRLKNGGIPAARILEPRIRPEDYSRIHIYKDGTLCLYDHRERPWKTSDNLHETIIPWLAEWLVFYELFLICGKWHGSEASHGDKPKEPQDATDSAEWAPTSTRRPR